tara:strand:+ start:1280 stop:1573 length:294 start_codon:yes stop_codon:yes gene_type:complete
MEKNYFNINKLQWEYLYANVMHTNIIFSNGYKLHCIAGRKSLDRATSDYEIYDHDKELYGIKYWTTEETNNYIINYLNKNNLTLKDILNYGQNTRNL